MAHLTSMLVPQYPATRTTPGANRPAMLLAVVLTVRRAIPPAVVALLTVLLAVLVAGAGPARAQQAPPQSPHAVAPAAPGAPSGPIAKGRVTGSIQGAPEGVALAGTRVVLVQFRLDAQGQPKGAPIQEQKADAKGGYVFENVPIESHAVYQVGARVNGQLIGSQPFTFPAGQRHVLLNLLYPHLVTDASTVRIEEGLIAVEPRRGAVLVTEVLHLVNSSSNVVEGVQHPLELSLPAGAEDLQMIREIEERNGHERLGTKLLIYGNLDPGRTTIAFRYRLSVWLGTVELHKLYPHPVGTLSVLAPQGSLHLHSPRFKAQETQTIEGVRYDTWAATDVPAQQPLTVELSGVPVRQEVYLIPTGGFIVLMVGVVLWFLRKRLRGAGTDEADSD
jgi:hypothetical protein